LDTFEDPQTIQTTAKSNHFLFGPRLTPPQISLKLAHNFLSYHAYKHVAQSPSEITKPNMMNYRLCRVKAEASVNVIRPHC